MSVIPHCSTLARSSIADPDVPTPLAYVDVGRLEANIARMAAAARRHGVALRPHTKTHKLAEVARLQLAAGATGLTVAKLGEAEALAEAGISTSFMVAQPYLGAEKARWHLALAEASEVVVCVDHLEPARAMGAEAGTHDRTADVVLIVDTGYGRFGVPPADAPALAKDLATLPGVRFRGIRSHSGDAYHAPGHQARMSITRFDATTMRDTAEAIRGTGTPCEIVSIGSTPGLADVDDDVDFTGITEWRPGNYVFFDGIQVSLGGATEQDCALRVITTVVSTPGPGRAVVDGGKKILTSTLDPYNAGHGRVVSHPGVAVVSVSEECGWVDDPAGTLSVGDRMTVIPNHACEVSNLVDAVAHGRDGAIDGYWSPAARGKVW